jgi:hypothetical protein
MPHPLRDVPQFLEDDSWFFSGGRGAPASDPGIFRKFVIPRVCIRKKQLKLMPTTVWALAELA